jgi:hypothetical protein
LPQWAVEATFHVEHIIARQHEGSDDPSNLALACDRCNLYKGPNLTAIDPMTGIVVQLFNPRRDDWTNHFDLRDIDVFGMTPIGRATVRLLRMNTRGRRQLRRALLDLGEL